MLVSSKNMMNENLFHFDVHPGLIIFLQICQIRYFLRKKRLSDKFNLYFGLHSPHTLRSTEMYILDSTYTSIYRDVYFALYIYLDLHGCIFCTLHTLQSTEMYILHSTYSSIYRDEYFALYIHLDLHGCIFCTLHTLQSTQMYILYSTYTSIYRDVYFALYIHFNLQRCIFWTPHLLQSTEMYILYSTYTSIYRDVYFALHVHFLGWKYQIGYNSLLFDVQSFKSHVEEGGGVMFLILCIAFFLK